MLFTLTLTFVRSTFIRLTFVRSTFVRSTFVLCDFYDYSRFYFGPPHINEQYLNSDVKYEIGIMYFYLCPCNQLLPPLKASGFTLLSCHDIVLGYIHVVQEVFHFWCYVFCFCPVFAVKITSPSKYGNYICKGGIVICLARHISTFSEKENLQRNISKRKGCRMAP